MPDPDLLRRCSPGDLAPDLQMVLRELHRLSGGEEFPPGLFPGLAMILEKSQAPVEKLTELQEDLFFSFKDFFPNVCNIQYILVILHRMEYNVVTSMII